MSFLIGVICLLGLMIMSFYFLIEKRRLTKLNSERPSFSRDDFFQYFRDKAVSERLIEAVYFVTRKRIKVKNFSVYPDDNVMNLFGFTDMERKDFITDICLGLNVAYPKEIEIKNYLSQGKSLETIEDILQFVNESRVKGLQTVTAYL